MSPADLASLVPELVLTAAGIVLLLADAFVPALRRLWTPLALLAVAGAVYLAWNLPAGSSFGGQLEASGVTLGFSGVVLLAGFLALLTSEGYLRREGILSGEYHALLLWCVVGLLLLVRATELLTLFVSLELLSLCLYALAAFHRRLPVAVEAAIKYFLMGAFVSAFVLLGVAILYGETGSTELPEIARALQAGPGSQPLATLGVLLLVAGFGFKMSLVPFHAWSPDAYQGAPSPFVAFLSVAPKAASALVLMRVLTAVSGGAVGGRWPDLVALLAVLSMVGGNLLALVQRDVKRMLAYSGIAHMGYLAIALVALDGGSWVPVLVYLVAYALMNAGAFGVVAMLYPRPGEEHRIDDLAGLGYRYPLLGGCLTVAMLSLAGIPPTLGFLGKYLVFLHAVESGQIWLAVVGVAASLVGVFYYLRVVYTLYMKGEQAAPAGLLLDGWGRLAAVLSAGGTLALGVWPWGLLRWMLDAVRGVG
jgi:NADH-quinone oxidoreductase subunit N